MRKIIIATEVVMRHFVIRAIISMKIIANPNTSNWKVLNVNLISNTVF